MNIGQIPLANALCVAPMAGVTDRPFRQLCKRWGAGYAVSEMVTSRPDLLASAKTTRRTNHEGESGPIAVQIAGTDAQLMADAARFNIDHGAQIIDINMGCPAKKVCNKWAGSALMQDEELALEIVQAVVDAAALRDVPVTVKMRTGWSVEHRNALNLARAFESAGVQMLTIHGRTREQRYHGDAEYETIASIKAAVNIPVVANGDIDSPEKARYVLTATGADGLMIGRAAQGRPWIFREIAHYLATGQLLAPPLVEEVKRMMLNHLLDHYGLYGDYLGVRTARKHIGWYVQTMPDAQAFRARLNQLNDCDQQRVAVSDYFDEVALRMDRMPGDSVTGLRPQLHPYGTETST